MKKLLGTIMVTVTVIFMIGSLLCCPIVNASEAGILLRTEEGIKAGKPFDVYVDFSAAEGIAAVHGALQYDGSRLELKNAELADDVSEDKFHWHAHDGLAEFAFSSGRQVSAQRTVRLRFSPLSEDGFSCQFSLTKAEICRNTEELLSVPELPVLSLHVTTESAEVSNRSVSREGSSSASGRKTSSAPQSGSESETAVSEDAPEETAEQTADGETGTPAFSRQVYYIEEAGTGSMEDQNHFLLLIGGIVLVITAVVLAYLAGAGRVKRERYQEYETENPPRKEEAPPQSSEQDDDDPLL